MPTNARWFDAGARTTQDCRGQNCCKIGLSTKSGVCAPAHRSLTLEQRLVALEVLNRTLMRLRRFSGAERAEVSSPSGLGILFAGIQAVASGLQFPDQWDASTQVAVTTTPSQTNFPSVRCTQGRVKLCTLIFMQRRGTTKLARLGAIHPVARLQTIRIRASLAFRKLGGA